MTETHQEQWLALGIDVDATLERFCGNTDLLNELLKAFAKENTLGQLPEAVAKRDPEAIEHIAHNVKGTSSNLGLTKLSRLCDHVTQAARTRQLDDIENLADAALACYGTIRSGIAAL